MNTVILDAYTTTRDDLSWLPLTDQCPEVNLTIYDRTAPEQTIARSVDAEALLTNKVIIDNNVMAQLSKLRYIGVLATGYNVVDIEGAHRRGIVVTNIPAYSTASVAQHVFAFLLNVVTPVQHYAEKATQWPMAQDFSWTDTPLSELAGKTLGIYGMGAIGTAVARIALAFGMHVCAVTSKAPEALLEGVEAAGWDDVLTRSDVISLHCPLTPSTRHLLNADAIARLRPSAIVINTARGPLVDEAAMADALRAGRLRAYCADVVDSEPPTADNPLLHVPGAFITPHIAWATQEARERLIATATANLRAFIDGRPRNTV